MCVFDVVVLFDGMCWFGVGIGFGVVDGVLVMCLVL